MGSSRLIKAAGQHVEVARSRRPVSSCEVVPPSSVAVRRDIAGQYTAWHRLDTGLGLIVEEVNAAGFGNSTLTIFFSDNGIPFPSGKTNLGEQGQADPLLVSSPGQATRGRRSSAVVSSLDLMPTMLSWLRVPYPSGATAAGKPARGPDPRAHALPAAPGAQPLARRGRQPAPGPPRPRRRPAAATIFENNRHRRAW